MTSGEVWRFTRRSGPGGSTGLVSRNRHAHVHRRRRPAAAPVPGRRPALPEDAGALRQGRVHRAARRGEGGGADPRWGLPGPAGQRRGGPRRPVFGDYSTNAGMLLAPALGEPPRPVAEKLGASLGQSLGAAVEKVDVAGPGFLNLFMTDAWYRQAVARMADAGEAWGGGRADPAERILVEFVSANPTGPVTVASGRNAAYGDSLARLLAFAGNEIEREYYVNDYGT